MYLKVFFLKPALVRV